MIKYSHKNIQIKKDKYLTGTVAFVNKLGITANMISVVGFVFGIFSVYFLFENNTKFYIFYLFNYSLDVLDGSVARSQKTVSKSGKYVDFALDVIYGLLIIVKTIIYIPDFAKLMSIPSLFAILLGFLKFFLTLSIQKQLVADLVKSIFNSNK